MKRAILFSLCLGLSIVSCRKNLRQVPVDAQKGGTLLVGMVEGPSNLNPLFPPLAEENPFYDLIFTSLFRLQKGQVIPALAESWEYSEDLKSITFYLRKDFFWHDGEPVTANDLLFTYKLIHEPKTNSPLRSKFRMVKKFEVLDSYTVRFTFDRVYLYELLDCNFYPLPAHLLEDKENMDKFFEKPVGNGPFTVKRWLRGDMLELSANPKYPYQIPLDGIIFKFYNSPLTVAKALEQGRIDLALNLNSEAVKYLKERDISVQTVKGNRVTFLGWNLTREPISNPKFRRAIELLLPKEKLIKDILSGEPTGSPIPPNIWAYDSTIQEESPNPESAKKILKEIGFDVKKFTLRIIVDSTDPAKIKVATAISEALKKQGIIIEVQALPVGEFLKKMKERDFDGYILSWSSSDYVDLTPLWHSEGILNFTGFKNLEVDSLLQSAILTINQRESKRAFSEFQHILSRENPAIFLFVEQKNIAYSDRVNNLTLLSPVSNLDLVWIPEDKQAKEIALEVVTEETVSETVKTEEPAKKIVEKPTPKEPPVQPPTPKPKETAEEALQRELAKKREKETPPAPEEKEEEIAKKPEEEVKKPEEPVTLQPTVVSNPEIVKQVTPTYPEEAKRVGAHGRVFLRLFVGKDGRVKRVEILRGSGYDILDDTAVEAAKKWIFKPAKDQKGNPVEFFTPLKFDF